MSKIQNILIGFLGGFVLGAVLVLWGDSAVIKELQETNEFLVKKLKKEWVA